MQTILNNVRPGSTRRCRMTERSRHVGTPCQTSRHPIADLTDVEQLLVWAVRSWAFAHQAARSIERDLVRTCGRADAEKAMMAIRAILVLVALYGRRGLRLAPPGWPAVTIDEFRLLQLFAAAQRGMEDRKSTRLNSSHSCASRMPSAA